jgi:plasmid maintenance system antidote protein VapI
MMVNNKLRICKMIHEKRQIDAQIASQIDTQIDTQILGVVTKFKDSIYCNRTNTWQELNDQFDLNNKRNNLNIIVK